MIILSTKSAYSFTYHLVIIITIVLANPKHEHDQRQTTSNSIRFMQNNVTIRQYSSSNKQLQPNVFEQMIHRHSFIENRNRQNSQHIQHLNDSRMPTKSNYQSSQRNLVTAINKNLSTEFNQNHDIDDPFESTTNKPSFNFGHILFGKNGFLTSLFQTVQLHNQQQQQKPTTTSI